MASTSFIGWQNWVKSSTLTAGAEASGMPVTNLAVDQCSTDAAWQTPVGVVTAAGGATVTVTFGTPRSVRMVGAFRTNLTAAATIQFDLYANTGPTLLYSILLNGPEAEYGQAVGVFPVDVAGVDYVVVSFNDNANPDNLLNIPGLFIGPGWNPGVGFSWDSAFGRNDRTDERRSAGGQLYPDTKWIQRRYEMRLAGVSQSEWRAQLDPFDRACRLKGNVLVIPDKSSATYTSEAVFGTVTPTADITFPAQAGDIRAWAGRVEERL